MRTVHVILLGVACLLVVLVIVVGMFLKVEEDVKDFPFPLDVRERTDIIVSDRISLGCFIPPDMDKTKFEAMIKKSENIKIEGTNKKLFDYCFSLGKKEGLLGGTKTLEWENIKESLPYGIKLNGYCYSCLECQCLEEDMPGWEGEDFLTERRSLDFGTPDPLSIGRGFEEQSFVEIRGQPSIFVVKPGEEPKLSIYSGIFLRGEKNVEKVSGALYNGTLDESNRISSRVGEERSCYFGNNWGNYFKCRKEPPQKSSDYCRVKWDCYTTEKYYDEDSSEICENFCSTDFKKGKATPTEIGDCQSGCDEGGKRKCYRECIIKTNNIGDCETDCLCFHCDETLGKFEIANNILCEEDSILTNDETKFGCEKFIEIEDSVFSVKPMEYTIFKVGNTELTNPDYRGLAWAVATIITKEPFSGTSCYGPNIYRDYFLCCDEVCKYSEKGCIEEGHTCIKEGKPSQFGLPTNCEVAANCSTTYRTEIEDPFVLCRHFCESRDAYYGDWEKIKKCQEGCDWAERQYEKPEFIGFQKNVDLVFVVDTSGSMCGSGSDEWASLCKIIGDITASVEKEDYKVNVTIYALGESGQVGSCKTNCASTCTEPNCRYKILDCSDIKENLEITIDCTDGNCKTESWGPGAEWAVKNHIWGEEILSKILFVVGDEGPYCGSPPINDDDTTSVERAVEAANKNKVTIFGLWGIDIQEGGPLQKLFIDISEPTGGSATEFDTEDHSEVTRIITNAIIRDVEFERGYDKFVDLTKEENTKPLESPYIWKEVYEEVFSNLIYIVDWNNPGSDWNYPLNGNDWTKIHTPILDKSVEFNSLLEKIKRIAQDGNS